MLPSYVEAVTLCITDGQSVDQVLANLQSVLARRGHERLYNAILRGVQKELEQQQLAAAVMVTVARDADAESPLVRELIAQLNAETAPVIVTVDSTLIGGAQVTYQHQNLDHTYKTALRHLYERVTT